jgi:NAD(P)-dependent dehydrogenase (short-subunit alcohol dehydrogenase family)
VLGHALQAEFSGAGYRVAGLRRADCDLGDAGAVRSALERVVPDMDGVDTLICNAAHLMMAPFAELAWSDFETAWRVSVGGAVGAVQTVLPGMLRRGRGTIIFTGATGSVRGTARFTAFASAKFALRGLAQSLAREVQPLGVHVTHVVLDGLLRGSPSVERFGGNEDRSIDPAEAARAYRWIAEQPPSSWTHELDLRPHNERF